MSMTQCEMNVYTFVGIGLGTQMWEWGVILLGTGTSYCLHAAFQCLLETVAKCSTISLLAIYSNAEN